VAQTAFWGKQYIFFAENSSPKCWTPSVVKKVPKEKNRPIGENSPILVALKKAHSVTKNVSVDCSKCAESTQF
jgi:hypothetical protein